VRTLDIEAHPHPAGTYRLIPSCPSQGRFPTHCSPDLITGKYTPLLGSSEILRATQGGDHKIN
jgi:hypothetical protein